MSAATDAVLDSCETLIECVQSNVEHSDMVTQFLNQPGSCLRFITGEGGFLSERNVSCDAVFYCIIDKFIAGIDDCT